MRPKTAVVLGSGLGEFADRLTNKVLLDCAEIPSYPVPGVEGHSGKLVFGRISLSLSRTGPLVLLFVGRSHYYESGDLDSVTYPIRVAHGLGIKNLILTNAAGGVNSTFSPGDLMVIAGHLNLTFQTRRSSLRRSSSTSVYDIALINLAHAAARKNHIALRQGVYCGVTGPSYETAAEIGMIRRLGADAVGMSTVHEATVASEIGMRVLGISLITNLATGLASEPATHEEVIRVARQARKKFEALLTRILAMIKG